MQVVPSRGVCEICRQYGGFSRTPPFPGPGATAVAGAAVPGATAVAGAAVPGARGRQAQSDDDDYDYDADGSDSLFFITLPSSLRGRLSR